MHLSAEIDLTLGRLFSENIFDKFDTSQRYDRRYGYQNSKLGDLAPKIKRAPIISSDFELELTGFSEVEIPIIDNNRSAFRDENHSSDGYDEFYNKIFGEYPPNSKYAKYNYMTTNHYGNECDCCGCLLNFFNTDKYYALCLRCNDNEGKRSFKL